MVAAQETTYTERFVESIKKIGRKPESSKDVRWLAEQTGVSYQAMKKVIAGTTNMLAADNNVRAAKALRVNSEWLATGELGAHGADAAEIAAIYHAANDQGRAVLRATAHALIVEGKRPPTAVDEPEPPPEPPTPSRKSAKRTRGA